MLRNEYGTCLTKATCSWTVCSILLPLPVCQKSLAMTLPLDPLQPTFCYLVPLGKKGKVQRNTDREQNKTNQN
eukprot:m.67189 g.67189  ORF g.67189 m.67189 type:complete len:73 (-) comp19783_c0_seq2:662-880(-)